MTTYFQRLFLCAMTIGKKISFIILSHGGNRIKQLSVPVSMFLLLALVSICSVTILGFVLLDYHGLRQQVAETGRMAQRMVDQQNEITQQRLQIQSFAREIDTLKESLVRLNRFEEKIRVIANLDPMAEDDNLFGVGGATPEDLDPQLELSQGHEDLMRDMHAQINELDSASHRQQSSFGLLLKKLEGRNNLLASTPAIRPTSGWVTSRFGYRTSPFTGRKELHKGMDIANRKGTAIMATADGVVSFVGNKNSMGKMVVIDHGHGMVTRYAHLSKTLKKSGERVKRGDIIAQMGSSGRSTGPHLHYEVQLNGVPVNPAKYILN
ncbi:M23 family metallopeptidase [Desulfosarcina ovata]|nr:M23 family metallopeptidase [Desulfosarcina ovata]